MKIKKFFQNVALKLFNWWEKVSGKNEEAEVKPEENSLEEKKNHKFFGRTSLFDDLQKIKLEILPIEKYSADVYQSFKDKVEKLSRDIKIFYEEQEVKQEFTLKLTMGVTDYSKDINQRIYNLLEEVKEFKRTDYNYKYSVKSLEKLKELLNNNYKKLLSNNSSIDLLNKAFSGTLNQLEAITNLDFAENTVKKEEISKLMCECLYIFLKCNARCGFVCDIEEIKNVFYAEQSNFWDIFITNVSDLYEKVQIFEDEKYVSRHEPYLLAILEKSEVQPEALMNKQFMERFVENEKKILELHYYYSVHKNDDVAVPKPKKQQENVVETILEETKEVDPNIVKISDLVSYIEALIDPKSEDLTTNTKLYLFRKLILDFEYDITNYEVYKIVYFFSLKTFFGNHIRQVSDDDLMKKVFVSQKDTKVPALKKSDLEDAEMFKLFHFDVEKFNPEWVRKILSKSSVYFVEVESKKTSKIHEIHFSAEHFADCENIMKNLQEFKSVS